MAGLSKARTGYVDGTSLTRWIQASEGQCGCKSEEQSAETQDLPKEDESEIAETVSLAACVQLVSATADEAIRVENAGIKFRPLSQFG